MDPFIQFLLGQAGANAPVAPAQAQHQMPARAAVAPPQDEIRVESRPFNNSMREGLVRRGPFSMGRTGGNILGILGDALLVGGGRDPMYQPRLQRQREAEAMIDYEQDPRRALTQLSQINPERAADLWDKFETRQSLADYRQSQMDAQTFENEQAVHARALSFLGAATPRTYPAIRDLIMREYARRGVDPLFDLPEQYDEEALSSLARGGIPIDKQAELTEDRRYHDAQLAMDRREEYGRNWREAYGESAATHRNTADNATSRSNNAANNATKVATSGRGAGRPRVRFGRRADGTRYVLPN